MPTSNRTTPPRWPNGFRGVFLLERQAYGEVEGKVAFEAGMKKGEMLLVVSLEGGIDGFHTQVEADDEIVEVQA